MSELRLVVRHKGDSGALTSATLLGWPFTGVPDTLVFPEITQNLSPGKSNDD